MLLFLCIITLFFKGGVGVFAGELKKTYPDMDVSVLEMPAVISQVESYWSKRGGQPDVTFINGILIFTKIRILTGKISGNSKSISLKPSNSKYKTLQHIQVLQVLVVVW